MKHLITHTLLSFWLWWQNYDGDDDSKAKKDFENTINKIFFDNIYIKAGREFEDFVYAICKRKRIPDPDNLYEVVARKIAETVKMGTWQVPCKTTKIISGQEFLLYGKVDVLRGPEIFDIKFVKKYTGRKYFESTQHKMYFECLPFTKKVTYLISDGKDVYKEIYNRYETDSIISVIADWWSWVNQFPEYLEVYLKKWKAY